MEIIVKFLILLSTASYHFFASLRDRKKFRSPGILVDIGGYKLHLYSQGKGDATVVIDHSLGGMDGYFLVDKIAEIAKVCIYDRPGYGWSDPSPNQRCSQAIALELDILLEKAGISPPYILVGESFGSYNVRVYAHYFPEKVAGLVLTDGLHEKQMLRMPLLLKGLKMFFMSGFIMSVFGSLFGIVRILGDLSVFELLKKELSQHHSQTLSRVKRSFYSHNHWITMWREMWNLELSGRQAKEANDFGDLPIVNIKSSTFLKSTHFNFFLPLEAVDRLRNKMHDELQKLSSNCTQITANKSDHFVWIDEPETVVAAIEMIIDRDRDRLN